MGVFCLFVFVVFFVKKKVCSTDSAKKKVCSHHTWKNIKISANRWERIVCPATPKGEAKAQYRYQGCLLPSLAFHAKMSIVIEK